MLNQRNLIIVAVVLAAAKYLVVPAFEEFRVLSEEYQSVAIRYEKSISAIEKTDLYKKAISEYQQAASALGKEFGDPVNIDSYKLYLQEQVNEVASEHGIKLEKFGWSTELKEDVAGIYSGTLSLRFNGDTAASILAIAKLEQLVKISDLVSFTTTVQGYQRQPTDLGYAATSVEIAIWVKSL